MATSKRDGEETNCSWSVAVPDSCQSSANLRCVSSPNELWTARTVNPAQTTGCFGVKKGFRGEAIDAGFPL
jgi:hypothetical protein